MHCSGLLRAGCLGALVLAVLSAGCSGGRKPLFPASGQVLYQGKEPALGAFVVFHPVGAATEEALRPYGYVQKDGSFSLTTYKKDDGAPEGEYGVTIVWQRSDEKVLDREKRGNGPDLLQGRYGDPARPRFKVTVTRQQSEPFRFEVE
jgi:hypothetical protein